jgi:hypothetical protein
MGSVVSRSGLPLDRGNYWVRFAIHRDPCPAAEPLKRTLPYTGAVDRAPVWRDGTLQRPLILSGLGTTIDTCVAAVVERYVGDTLAAVVTRRVTLRPLGQLGKPTPRLDTLLINFEIK